MIGIRVGAMYDLFKHYMSVFVHAWGNRKAMDAIKYNKDEAAFLPASLSLQETPVSPAPRVAMWVIISFLGLTILWMYFGKMDVVETARGQIIVNDRSKRIQALETASITAIHVKDGQLVKAGDVLVELDVTAAQADNAQVQEELSVFRLQAARAQAMLQSLEQGGIPQLPTLGGVDGAEAQDVQRALMGVYEEYQAKLRSLESEEQRKQAEKASIQTQIQKIETTLPLIQERERSYKTLLAENYVSKDAYLRIQQAKLEQEGDLSTQRSRLNEVSAALKTVSTQKETLKAETRRAQLESLTQAQQKVASLQQALIKTQDRKKSFKIIAPVTGTVQQLAINTVGGVVTPAQVLMVVVPQDNPIEVEAMVENKDIGFVRTGQDAEVKVDSFPFTKYGLIHGSIVSLSQDAINDEKRGPIFSAKVKMQTNQLIVEGKPVRLSAGMAVTVEVKTGQRRVYEYFLSPLIQHGKESLRER